MVSNGQRKYWFPTLFWWKKQDVSNGKAKCFDLLRSPGLKRRASKKALRLCSPLSGAQRETNKGGMPRVWAGRPSKHPFHTKKKQKLEYMRIQLPSGFVSLSDFLRAAFWLLGETNGRFLPSLCSKRPRGTPAVRTSWRAAKPPAPLAPRRQVPGTGRRVAGGFPPSTRGPARLGYPYCSLCSLCSGPAVGLSL